MAFYRVTLERDGKTMVCTADADSKQEAMRQSELLHNGHKAVFALFTGLSPKEFDVRGTAPEAALTTTPQAKGP